MLATRRDCSAAGVLLIMRALVRVCGEYLSAAFDVSTKARMDWQVAGSGPANKARRFRAARVQLPRDAARRGLVRRTPRTGV